MLFVDETQQQPMLQELGSLNPALLRLITENQAEFLRLINEGDAEDDAEGYVISAILLIIFPPVFVGIVSLIMLLN